MSEQKIGELVKVPVDMLKVASTNNRTIIPFEEELAEMKHSIESIGVIEPIIINDKNEIVSGQLRWLLAKQANEKEIPCIRMKFQDEFSERIVSFVQDYHRIPLTMKEKCDFVKRCRELGKTLKEISDAVGVDIRTVVDWEGYEKTPPSIAEDKEMKKKYLEVGSKKRQTIRRATIKEPIGSKFTSELMKHIDKFPLRATEAIAKEKVAGLTVDIEERARLFEEPVESYPLRIPKSLWDKLLEVLSKKGIDMHKFILDAIEEKLKSLQ